MILPIPIYLPHGESTELDPTVCTIFMIGCILLMLALLLFLIDMIWGLPTVDEIVDAIRTKRHDYIEKHKPIYITFNLKTNERRRIMNPIRIANEVHHVSEVIFKQAGNSMTGNITRYYMTENPNILYAVEYRDWQEYEERFERRAAV